MADGANVLNERRSNWPLDQPLQPDGFGDGEVRDPSEVPQDDV